jgi:hypothetical protein
LPKTPFVKPMTAAAGALAVIIWLTVCIMVGGCGMKAPPEPPRGDRPPAVTDLNYSITDNTIRLSWTMPQTTAKAKNAVTGFIIYQFMQSAHERECPNCPVIFKKVGEVPVRRSGRGQAGAQPIVFVQTIVPGYRYIYNVRAFDKNDTLSRDSNLVEFLF